MLSLDMFNSKYLHVFVSFQALWTYTEGTYLKVLLCAYNVSAIGYWWLIESVSSLFPLSEGLDWTKTSNPLITRFLWQQAPIL